MSRLGRWLLLKLKCFKEEKMGRIADRPFVLVVLGFLDILGFLNILGVLGLTSFTPN